jgi:glutamine amidotransferase
MIGVVDYQVGNTGNVRRAFERLGEKVRLLLRPEDLDERISLAVLPGVGAFGPASERLSVSGWREALRSWALSGKPLLGICLGMQLLCEKGLEDGEHEGLGLIPGEVFPLKASKIPHMGWNTAEWTGMPPLFAPPLPSGSFFYFVHSFALPEGAFTAARTTLEKEVFSSMVIKDSVAGFQFHPERSGSEGLALLGETVRYLRKGAA